MKLHLDSSVHLIRGFALSGGLILIFLLSQACFDGGGFGGLILCTAIGLVLGQIAFASTPKRLLETPVLLLPSGLAATVGVSAIVLLSDPELSWRESSADVRSPVGYEQRSAKESAAARAKVHSRPESQAQTTRSAASVRSASRATRPRSAVRPSALEHTDTLDDLLDAPMDVETGSADTAAPSAAAGGLPKKPSRDAVLGVMNDLKEPVVACADGRTGVAFADITVAGKTGRVTRVEVTGMVGDVGSCIARTVRRARFPTFSSGSFQFKYPFRL